MEIIKTFVGLGSTCFGALVLIPQLRKIIKLGIHRVQGLAINSIIYSLTANMFGLIYGIILGQIFVIIPAALNVTVATIILLKFASVRQAIRSDHEIDLLDSSEYTKEWHLDEDTLAQLRVD